MRERPEGIDEIVRAFLDGDGVSPKALRRAVMAHAGGGAEAEAPDLPPDLAAFAEKVAKHAYRMTDEDLDRLRAAGHAEDVILEVALGAAFGASLPRLDAGLRALAAATAPGTKTTAGG